MWDLHVEREFVNSCAEMLENQTHCAESKLGENVHIKKVKFCGLQDLRERFVFLSLISMSDEAIKLLSSSKQMKITSYTTHNDLAPVFEKEVDLILSGKIYVLADEADRFKFLLSRVWANTSQQGTYMRDSVLNFCTNQMVRHCENLGQFRGD